MDNKEKLEEAKRLYETANADQKYVLESLFPELRESEDERIRKNCIHFLELQKTHHAATFEIEECVVWLEKQCERNPAWSEEDEGLLYWTVNNLEEIKSRYGEGYGRVGKCRNWVLSLKDRLQPQPKQEWNSGDDAHFHSLITHLEDFIASHPNTTGADIQGENIAWLESLKDRYTWKPSDEQMKALYNSIPEDVKEISEREMLLNELYKDLKKLR